MREACIVVRGAASRLVAAAGLALLVAAPAGAANKEHQQMLAEIRMLQEQNAQLQQSIGSLIDALKVVTAKVDEQTAANRKTAADQRLLIDGLSGELRIVREKLDDTNVRLGSISQEVDSLRNSIPQAPPVGVVVDPTSGGVPGTPPATGALPAATPGAAAAPPVTTAPPVNPAAGMSPARLWDMAFSDYAAGQWPLAIQGFETYLRTFPRTERADDAQYYIGEAYQLDGKYREAIAAYDRVIADYPQADKTAEAYYKRGVIYGTLKEPEKARESYEAVLRLFPNSESAGLARQRLSTMPAR